MADNNTIVLKLQVQEAQAKVNIKNLEKAIDKLDGRTKEYRLAVAKLNAEEQKLINTRKQLVKASGDLSKSSEALIGNNKQGLNGVSKASGSATAAAMELGRVVSDAPYGIRGMANNVSQLASQLFFMAGQQETATVATKSSTVATTTDTVAKGANTTATVVATGATVGFTGAVKMMWSALMGPMGVLLAIQAVIAGLDYFYGTATKSKKAVSELTDATYANGLVAKQYVKELENVNITEERRKLVTQELIKLVPTLKEEDLAYGKNLDKVRLKIRSYVLAQASRIEVEKLAQENSAILSKKNELENIKSIDSLILRTDAMRTYLLEKGGWLGTLVEERVKGGDVATITQRFESILKTVNKTTDPILKRVNELTQSLELDPDKLKKKKPKTKLLEIKDFDKQVEDYLSQIASVSEKEEILNAKLNSDKVLIQEEYHLKKLGVKNEENKAKFKQQSDAYRVEYEAFLNQEVRLGNLTKKEAEVKLNKFDKDAKAQQDKSDANYKILLSKWNTYYSDKLFIALSGEMKVAKTEDDANAKRLASINAFIEQYKVLSSSVSDFLQAESDRELTIEQNKTNVLNAELNDRLLNESLSADQRASIQNQIAQNDEKLRVKQEAIKRKAFNTQKAFNIAAALVDTYAAASSAYRNTLANPINALDPTAGLLRAKINAGIAMAGGLAQVAAIARQKYQSSSASTPINTGGGGASGGGGRSEPSFNIVGRSQDSILLSAIQSQFDKPLKAYVVARDVTNQQQLDGVISTAAST